MNRGLVVGLTGGIGSGKSAAADEFARLGAAVIDSDRIAHELTAPGGAAMPAIVARFGADMQAADGRLDRQRMRERVFADPGERRALEALLHPLIREQSDAAVVAAFDAGAPYAVLVVPLLIESTDFRKRVDRVLVVDAAPETCIERVARRSGLSREATLAIMATQATRSARLAAADDVIVNGGSLDAMIGEVRQLHASYLALAGHMSAIVK
jgi:dephospho-CoA kinase